MKKLCRNCGHENPYELEICEKCGESLGRGEICKICPRCGKKFPVVKDECDVCREHLVVIGRQGAQVFNENEDKRSISVWMRIIGVFLPVFGIICAVVYTIIKKEDGLITPEDARTFVMTCVFGQLVILFILYFVFSLIFGNGTGLMKQYFGG